MAAFEHKKFIPGFPLNNYIDYLWKLKCDDVHADISKQRILPDGGVEVILNLDYDQDPQRISPEFKDEPWLKRAATIGGQRTRVIETQFPSTLNLLGIRFKPHGFNYFFDVGLHELVDDTFSLDDVVKIDARSLVEKIRWLSTDLDQFAMLEGFLMKHFSYQSRDELEYTVKEIVANNGNLKVQGLYDQLGRASKNFLCEFKQRVGLTPKKLSDIYRFKRVINIAKSSTADKGDWQTILFECGYYDQAHFIREFKRYAATTPSKYFCSRISYFSQMN